MKPDLNSTHLKGKKARLMICESVSLSNVTPDSELEVDFPASAQVISEKSVP